MSPEIFNKMRGGYYTPSTVTDFLVNWAIKTGDESVLEPSCGSGNFIKSISNKYEQFGKSDLDKQKNILGIELYETEAQKSREYGATVITSDFFGYYKEHIQGKKKFDVILGNPPFIRYQNFEEQYRDIAFELCDNVGLKLNRLTNIWIPFLVLSTECLNDSGKLGMVIPAELFQVNYAASTRKYLAERYEHITIITFKKLLFEGTQEEVILLLGSKKSTKKGIEVVEIEDANELSEKLLSLNYAETKEIDHTTEKWIKYYLSGKELELLRKLEFDERLTVSTDLFETNVGVVSGQNKFFVINKETVDKYSLKDRVIPIVGRAEQLSGIIFSNNDFEKASDSGKKVYLFTPDNLEFEQLTDQEKKYIRFGERHEFQKGYKCRIRKRWYIVPLSWKPEAFMLRQINKFPRIVLNNTNATNTDTLHKIRFFKGVDGKIVCAAFINSFTFAQSEITGRSYGGGVMTFEPGEVRRLRIPMKNAEELDVEYIDHCLRNNHIQEALNHTDNILLKKGLGLSESEILMLRNIWNKLSDRRIKRKLSAKYT